MWSTGFASRAWKPAKAWREASIAGAWRSTWPSRDILETFLARSELFCQMPRAVLLLCFVAARYCLGADAPAPRETPNYSTASILNAADNQSDTLAPNTIGSIYGTNLAFSTAGLMAGDVQGVLPIWLGSMETTVFVGNEPAGLF